LIPTHWAFFSKVSSPQAKLLPSFLHLCMNIFEEWGNGLFCIWTFVALTLKFLFNKYAHSFEPPSLSLSPPLDCQKVDTSMDSLPPHIIVYLLWSQHTSVRLCKMCILNSRHSFFAILKRRIFYVHPLPTQSQKKIPYYLGTFDINYFFSEILKFFFKKFYEKKVTNFFKRKVFYFQEYFICQNENFKS